MPLVGCYLLLYSVLSTSKTLVLLTCLINTCIGVWTIASVPIWSFNFFLLI
jgi:hypothetical protein